MRRTLGRATPRIDGVGLHTGAPSWVRLLPVPATASTAGIVFRGPSGEEAVDASHVLDTRRCTVVSVAGHRLQTIEHLMSALAGLGVTDAIVEFDGPEAPILDGSASGFAREILSAGIVDLPSSVPPIVIREPIDVIGQKGERIVALPSDSLRITVVLEYPCHAAIGTQAASWSALSGDYATEVARARTYGFLSELDQMRAAGLASGASLENCIALQDDGSADPRTPLRYANEPARHKLLDVIGDLALAGRPLQGHVVALKPSHAVNCDLARQLSEL